MEISNEEKQGPSYSDLFHQIKKQIGERKNLLMRRVFFVAWPVFLYIFVFSVIKNFGISGDIADTIYTVMLVLLPFALIYFFVMTHIFSTEKVIWVDACGDGRQLEAAESLRIARKLFWVTLRLKIRLFFQYYFPPLAMYLFLFIMTIYLIAQKVYLVNVWVGAFVFIVGGPVLIWLYYLYIEVKLRYVWFVFLDRYSEGMHLGEVFDEMAKLNSINRSDAFRKSLAVAFGSGVLQDAAQLATGSVFSQIGRLGKGAKVAGDVASAYSSELIGQTASLVKLAANYVLYQYSREQLYGKSQAVNEHLYALSERSS